ncbi:MAG TPA: TlpA disulfide reductase family protein [Ferruginibacter sp.]|mgnify:CR=1 FL=1|nr:TlpA disulfide reductase family protein [Ferruginibacter sp.]HMP22097.1 TlpA disulfide reductase family protein [Ferruginibacter sp.]
MIKIPVLIALLFTMLLNTQAQPGRWIGSLHRSDGNNIVFHFEWKKEKGKDAWYIRNAKESIRVDNMIRKGDSMIVHMPVFESHFRIKVQPGKCEGVWIKGGAYKTQVMPFTAVPGKKRFNTSTAATKNITGRWAVYFAGNKKEENSVGEFVQKGNIVHGTFLNASGDYRYQEGVVAGDSLFLSCFDGSHAYLFKALIADSATITNGTFYAGATYTENWTAQKNSQATVPGESVKMYLRPGEESLHFTFNDLNGKPVSILDERYKNKVVIVQLMGSWCPNCMDETAFLSSYYNNNKHRAVEVIALAYEYSADWQRSVNSLTKIRQRFDVQYPILITGVPVTDSLRTEKTLPELTPIRFFPSSVIIDKKGKVRKIDTDFVGPAAPEQHAAYTQHFEHYINELLKEE